MGLTFFAADEDLVQVWTWLFQVQGMEILIAQPEPGKQARKLEKPSEVEQGVGLLTHRLAAWPSTVGGKPRRQRVTLDDETRRQFGARARTLLHSPAFISVRRNNEQRGCLASADISCWTEKGARQRSIYADEFLSEVDWTKLASIVSSIQRRITKSAPAKLRSYPIMAGAFERLRDGELELWDWGEGVAYPSPLITVL